MTSDTDSLLANFVHPAPVLLVITGPSGVGKDSAIEQMQQMGEPFHFVVTATDRAPRSGETRGVDYHFVSTEEFEQMIEQNELLEHACVYGQYKGVPRAEVKQALAAGTDAVMRVDVQGAETIRDRIAGAVTVFLAPPSLDALASRLKGRGEDSAEQIEKRLQVAEREMTLAESFDYVVINHDGRLEQAAQQILAIMEAEKHRTHRQPIAL